MARNGKAKPKQYTVRAKVDAANWPGWKPAQITKLIEQHMKARNLGKEGGPKKRCLFVMMQPNIPSNPGGNTFESIIICPTWPCWK